MWLNYGCWNKLSLYHEHFNDLQGENIYCFKTKQGKIVMIFLPIGVTWAYSIKQYFTEHITWHATIKSLLNIRFLPSIKLHKLLYVYPSQAIVKFRYFPQVSFCLLTGTVRLWGKHCGRWFIFTPFNTTVLIFP